MSVSSGICFAGAGGFPERIISRAYPYGTGGGNLAIVPPADGAGQQPCKRINLLATAMYTSPLDSYFGLYCFKGLKWDNCFARLTAWYCGSRCC